MKTHIQIVAILNIAAGALYLIAAAFVFLFIGGLGAVVLSQGDHQAAGIVGILGTAIACFLGVLSLPSILAGWALLNGKSWGRALALVLAALHIFNVPIGTVLGIYTFWALLSEEPRQLPAL